MRIAEISNARIGESRKKYGLKETNPPITYEKPNYNFIFKDSDQNFHIGLAVLQKLTDGKVHLAVHSSQSPAKVFAEENGIQLNIISGPHPSGNVGVQIHHIDPVSKGQVVWCVNPQDVVIIGRLFSAGEFDTMKVIALTGSQVERPKYYKAVIGTSVKHFIADAGLRPGENRVISGNVLTGKQIPVDGYLGYYDSQVTIIPENHEPEFMGWLAPGFNKFSASRTFFSWLQRDKKYQLDTNMHGEERPFVMTGQYEKVFPMDIYPVHLLKAVLIEDLELMENLGIYEVVEEDFALCEFVCTSKIESQDIIRRGLDLIRKEMS